MTDNLQTSTNHETPELNQGNGETAKRNETTDQEKSSISFETDLTKYPSKNLQGPVRLIILPISWEEFIGDGYDDGNGAPNALLINSNTGPEYRWKKILAYPAPAGSQTIIEHREETPLGNLAAHTFHYGHSDDSSGHGVNFILDPLGLKPSSDNDRIFAHRGAVFTEKTTTVYYSAEAPQECVNAILKWDPTTYGTRRKSADEVEWKFPEDDDDHQPNEQGDNQVQYRIDREFISRHGNVLIQGVAGCGKSHLLESLQREYEGNVEVVVFHPSTTYEDFVRGLRPSESSFEVRDGIFLELCKKAANHPDTDYLLFIDEINRANTARVLGDLMLVLEKSKRRTFKEGVPALEVTRPVPAENESFASAKLQLAATQDDAVYGTQKGNQYLSVPSNLHVVGTMNTTDRSTGTIDLALQRRFKVVVQRPLSASALESALLEAIAEKSDEAAYLTNDEDASALHQEVIDLVGWWNSLNQKLEKQVGPDAMMGHSYFFSTIGDDYADNAEEEETAEDEDSRKRRAYLDNVTSMVLNQLAEVAQLFNMSKQTLSDVQRNDKSQSGVPGYEVKHKGEGLGSMPQVMRINRDEAEASTTAPADGSKDDSPEV